MKEIDRLPSKFGAYDIAVAEYHSTNLDEDLRLMVELPQGASIDNITDAYSVQRVNSSEPVAYVKYAMELVADYAKEGKSILLAGLGGGSIHTELQKTRYLQVRSIEADASVVALARKHFGFRGTITTGRFENEVSKHGMFDCIIVNAHSSSKGTAPSDFASFDFIQKLSIITKIGGSIFYAGFPTLDASWNKLGYEVIIHSKVDEDNGSLLKWTQLKKLT